MTIPELPSQVFQNAGRNIRRVKDFIKQSEGLVELADALEQPAPDIRDSLRLTVVLLHASLEDFIRSVALYCLPKTKSGLESVPLAGAGSQGRADKYKITDLIQHRGKTVEELLDQSIAEWLGRQTFNNATDVNKILQTIGADSKYCRETYPGIDAMTKRRHQIVHNADRVQGTNELADITIEQVIEWNDNIENLMASILAKLEENQLAQAGEL